MGLSKDRPSIVPIEESDSRRRAARRCRRAVLRSPVLRPMARRSAPPSRWERQFPSACRPCGFPPPRRFVPPRPCDHLQAAADPGVHRVSSCRETGFPAVHLLPFEAFPPPTATASETNLSHRGLASPPRPFPASAFTANLPFTPFLSLRDSAAVARHIVSSRARTSRSCSIVGSVACPAVADRTHPVLPWACPTRPPA